MPELPEVQTIVSELRSAGIIGQKITGSIIRWPPLIKGHSVSCFKKLIHGSRIRGISRRGKFIVITLSNRLSLLIHLRMSGQFNLVAAGRKRESHQHIILQLGGKRELRYRDTRKFGRWQLASDPLKILATLGPEPLAKSFSPKELMSRLKAHHRQLKPFLLDQGMIAGLGNIYADEALWEARLHPRRLSNSLNERESSDLYKAIRCVLRRAIRNKGTSLGTGIGNYYRLGEKTGQNQNKLKVSRHSGSLCPKCGAAISRLLVGQRATYICAQCQGL
ncbi:MAG: DNA-formamidopyrimidine glycosylase [Kiritimatiellia bacterium]|nr:DNA-formamidopyrimidine glycosylase [Kiritimatiellia bacterium]